jgi:hypothetical protein
MIYVNRFAWQKFLLEEEVRACKVIVNTANQQGYAAREHVDNLPTF